MLRRSNNISYIVIISVHHPEEYSITSRPVIPRSDIDQIIRDAHLVDKVEKDMMKRAMWMQVDHHALYVGGAQPKGAGADGGSSGRGGRGAGEVSGTRTSSSRSHSSARSSYSNSKRTGSSSDSHSSSSSSILVTSMVSLS